MCDKKTNCKTMFHRFFTIYCQNNNYNYAWFAIFKLIMSILQFIEFYSKVISTQSAFGLHHLILVIIICSLTTSDPVDNKFVHNSLTPSPSLNAILMECHKECFKRSIQNIKTAESPKCKRAIMVNMILSNSKPKVFN